MRFYTRIIKGKEVHYKIKDDEYVPTPEEIEAACKEIQKEWEPEEFALRSGRAKLVKSRVTGGRIMLEQHPKVFRVAGVG